jgi:hypothetical protein
MPNIPDDVDIAAAYHGFIASGFNIAAQLRTIMVHRSLV